MATGWVNMDKGWYYFDPNDGKCTVNLAREINDSWYMFGKDGKMLTGWQQVDGAYYYFHTDGRMLIGWLSDGTNNYYMDPAN